jgi:hypothetical protein
VVPATQVPDPVQPIPPHCDHSARFPAGAALVVATADVDVVFVVPVDVVFVVPDEDAALLVVVAATEEELTLLTTPPGPATLVVIVPFSMYTPLK